MAAATLYSFGLRELELGNWGLAGSTGLATGAGALAAEGGGAGGGGEHTVTVGTAPKGSKGKKLRFPVRPDILFLMAACRSQALNTPVT